MGTGSSLARRFRRPLRLLAAVAVAATAWAATAAASPAPVRAISLPHLESEITAGAHLRALPDLVVPLSQVPSDSAATLAHGCLVSQTATTPLGDRPASCDFGDVRAARTMVLYGDSNAWMWLPAFNELGIADGFRVELDARAGCEVADLTLLDNSASTRATAEACTGFRAFALHQIAVEKPFLVVVVDYEYTDHLNLDYAPYRQSAYLAALTSTIATIHQSAATTVMLSPPPPHFGNLVTCLSQNAADIQACAVPAACLDGNNYRYPRCQYPAGSDGSIKNIIGLPGAVKAGHGLFINVSKLFCTSVTCPPVIDNTVVMFDQIHVSEHYVWLIELAFAGLFPPGILTPAR